MHPSPRPVRTLRIASPRCHRVLLPALALEVPWPLMPSPRSTADVSESKYTLMHSDRWMSRYLVGFPGAGMSEKMHSVVKKLQKFSKANIYPTQKSQSLGCEKRTPKAKGCFLRRNCTIKNCRVWHRCLAHCLSQQKCMPVVTNRSLSLCALCCRPIVSAYHSLTDFAFKASRRPLQPSSSPQL